MKVLQINNLYQNGSTGKITYDIHSELLKHGIESVVCYGRGRKINEPHVYKTCGELYSKINHFFTRLTGLMYGGCFFSTNKLIRVIKKEKPDVVHLQCLNGYFVNIYRLVSWLKKQKIKTVLTLHAEFMYTANCGHALDCEKWKSGCGKCPRRKRETGSLLLDATHKSWRKMKKAFDGFDDDLIITSVSPWLMERAKLSPILIDKRHEVVLNGVNTEIFHYYGVSVAENLKRELGIPDDKKIIFHATPGFNNDKNHIKGGYYVLKLAEQMKNENVVFIVAGEYEKELNVSDNIILLGKVSNQTRLAELYSMADITLLTSRKETFSMVTAESLCCGTPIVGFRAGAPEQITIPEYSKFVEYGDEKSLQTAVKQMLMRELLKENVADVANQKYAKTVMTENYIKIYETSF